MQPNYNCEKYLSLLPGTRIIHGVNRATILNFLSDAFDVIPKELAGIIEIAKENSLSYIFSLHDKNDWDVLHSYIDFVVSKNYCAVSPIQNNVLIAENDNYNNWDTPFQFTNAIVDYSVQYDDSFKKAIHQLAKLSCHTLQVRFFTGIGLGAVEDFLEEISGTGAYSGISIVADYSLFNLKDENFETIFLKYPAINEFILYNAPFDEYQENKKFRCKILLLQEHVNEKSCGAVSALYFSSNIESYTESLHHNTCLNRKIAIDTAGNIKNCPSMKENFGNIKDTTLEEAVNKPGFKKYWDIKKDEVTKCRDCEFRHVCTDCRAYVDDPDDMYSAPLKCGYDPYTCEWQEWSTNPLKQKAIDYYGMREIQAGNEN